jgi:hypothetical protein
LGDNHAFGGSILETDQRAGRRCGLSDCIAGFGGRDFSLGVNADGQRITSLYRLMEFQRQAAPIYIAFKKLSPESQGTQW